MPPKLLFLTSQCTNYKKIAENELSNSHSTELIKVITQLIPFSSWNSAISWSCIALMMNKRQHWWNGLQFLFRSLFYTILALWFVFYNLHSTKSSTSQIRLRDKPLPLNIQSLRRSSFIDFGRSITSRLPLIYMLLHDSLSNVYLGYTILPKPPVPQNTFRSSPNGHSQEDLWNRILWD